MKSETIAERCRRKLVVEPFVQRDHAEPGRHPQRKPVALDERLPRIHRGGDMHRRRGRQPLRHRHHEHAAVGFRQQAAFGNRPSGEQGRVEVEPAEQASVGNVQRQMLSAAGRSATPRAASSASAREPGRRATGPERRRCRPDRPRTTAPRSPHRTRRARLLIPILPQWRGRPARWNRRRRAGCVAGGDATPTARRGADVRRRRSWRASSAASARAARISVNSPRKPSVPSAMQSLAARSSAMSDTVTDGRRSRADVIFLRSLASSLAHVAVNAALSLSKSSRRRTTSMRLRQGRPASSPRPTGRTGRAIADATRPPRGCRCRPARSARDAGCSGPRARPRSRRRRRRRAADRPDDPPADWLRRCRGTRDAPAPAVPARTPSRPRASARSRSSAPTTRSSVAPSGRSTTGTGTCADFSAPLAARARHSSQNSAGRSGSQL